MKIIDFFKKSWKGAINQNLLLKRLITIQVLLIGLCIIVTIIQFKIQNKSFNPENYNLQLKTNFSMTLPILVWMIAVILKNTKKVTILLNGKWDINSIRSFSKTVISIFLLVIIYISYSFF